MLERVAFCSTRVFAIQLCPERCSCIAKKTKKTPVTASNTQLEVPHPPLSCSVGGSYYLLAKAHVQDTVRRGGKAKGACTGAAAPNKGAPPAAGDKSVEDPGEKAWYLTSTTCTASNPKSSYHDFFVDADFAPSSTPRIA